MDLTLRKSYRSQLTRLVNTVDEVLQDESVSVDDIAVLRERIEGLKASLKDLNNKLAPSFKEEQFEDECKKIVEYEDAATKAIAQLRRRIQSDVHLREELHQELDDAASGSDSTHPKRSSNVGNNQKSNYQRTVRLPRIEIAKFSGDVSLWPEFWEQFNVAIHQNNTLDNIAKFAYLKSYLTGKALITISGLASGKNTYDNALELLKSEYACTEKIIDTYVQKLWSMPQLKHDKDTFALRTLFNTVTTIIKSLSTLGISADQYGLLVKSIVFKALPYSMRVTYKKQRLRADSGREHADNESVALGSMVSTESVAKTGDFDTEIKELLHFIKVELDSIEQASGTSSNHDTKDFKKPNRFVRNEKSTSGYGSEYTAAGLFTGVNEMCLFCKSKSHLTASCDSSISINAKKDILKSNKLCFRCLKPNHNSKFCKTRNISSNKCKRRHVTTMCESHKFSDFNEKKDLSNNPSNKPNNGSVALIAGGIVDNIYLKTACAFVLTNSQETLIRMVIDGGSQLSFIREEVSHKLGLPKIGTHRISIQGFGQSARVPARLCNRVKVKLKSQFNDTVVELCAIEVPQICFDNLKPPSLMNPVIRDFSLKNNLADLVKTDQPVISGFSLLIGSNNYWKIVSNSTVNLTESLKAINTQFGWTLHGVSELNDEAYLVNFTETVVLHAQSYTSFNDLSPDNATDSKKLWDLETLGISAYSNIERNEFTESGCVAYIDNLVSGKCSFIASKHRGAPLNKNIKKMFTLPKLELTVAFCAARLCNYLLHKINLPVKDVTLCSDYWIKGVNKKCEPYVKNRVLEIDKLKNNATLRHCLGEENPADLIARGVNSANVFINSEVWLIGPTGLTLDKEVWTENRSLQVEDSSILTCQADYEEVKEPASKLNLLFDSDRYSDVENIIRITEYVRRYLNNLNRKKVKISGRFTVDDVNKAEVYWVKVVQQQEFSKEVFNLNNQTPIATQTKLLELIHCLDQKATLSSAIRKRYWIVKVRQSIKTFINKCLKCKRLKGNPADQLFAPLPKDRVTLSRSLDVTGIMQL
ncbi:uncharacterized protein LOC116175670 [Photinus pyralis]|uniref:uncharacterized protein LOC116175670 n=1 Tax=Photinus pyralis TaxID=7054 RepID=UPI0012675FBA|nr:uncharacterized protein LOC116175670 [Photinus pyralis]